jgi:hypothetical protein
LSSVLAAIGGEPTRSTHGSGPGCGESLAIPYEKAPRHREATRGLGFNAWEA